MSVAKARPGDVVQIADDHYTEPDANYPGLHTFVIAEVVALGVFNGWDSNSNWDGVVRFREMYEPGKAAGRYPNLNYRIYRFPTPENPVPLADELVGISEKTWLPAVGDAAIVIAGGDSLNLRAAQASPSVSSPSCATEQRSRLPALPCAPSAILGFPLRLPRALVGLRLNTWRRAPAAVTRSPPRRLTAHRNRSSATGRSSPLSPSATSQPAKTETLAFVYFGRDPDTTSIAR